jgi:hypothetical protein
LFFETSVHPAGGLREAPITYRGGELRYTSDSTEAHRIIRALLPYLEKLATSHGRLLDQVGETATATETGAPMIRLGAADLGAATFAARADAFDGYEPVHGLGPNEGPVAESYLPAFHWGYAPSTQVRIPSTQAREARISIEALTYSDGQRIRFELNGETVHEHAFQRVNQRERISVPLALRAGENTLTLHYSQFLQTEVDPRKLAVIFLALRVV